MVHIVLAKSLENLFAANLQKVLKTFFLQLISIEMTMNKSEYQFQFMSWIIWMCFSIIAYPIIFPDLHYLIEDLVFMTNGHGRICVECCKCSLGSMGCFVSSSCGTGRKFLEAFTVWCHNMLNKPVHYTLLGLVSPQTLCFWRLRLKIQSKIEFLLTV